VDEELDLTAWAKMRGLKEPYPLIFHLLDTAAVALALWDRFLTTSQRRIIAGSLGVGAQQARSLVAFWAGIHDIGKLTPGFARCNPEAWSRVSPLLRGDEGDWRPEGHDVAGLRTVSELLGRLGYELDGHGPRHTGWQVAQIVGGHHGVFRRGNYLEDCVGLYAGEGLGGKQWQGQREQHVRVVHSTLGTPPAPGEVPAATAVLVTGIVILADWLASQEHFILDQQAHPAADAPAHFAQSSRKAEGLVSDAGLDGRGLVWHPFDYDTMFGITEPNPLQESVLRELAPVVQERGSGILVVTTSMGDGKTELALAVERILAAAAGTDGFFFALPTMATSDQMYQRVRDYVERATSGPAAVTLAHSTAWLNAAYTAPSLVRQGPIISGEHEDKASAHRNQMRTAASQWLQASKRPLLARAGTGTIDQGLAAVLPVRHNALRLLALSGRTLIVDEAHACDPYMQVLLQRLLTWLAAYGCPVILLSATLPGTTVDRYVRAYLKGAGLTKRMLPTERYRPSYPGWLYVDAATGTATSVSAQVAREQAGHRHASLNIDIRHVHHHDYEPDALLPKGSRFAAIATALQPLVESGGTAAVVCTTVADAQATFEYLRDVVFKDLSAAEDVTLLHARFPAKQREAKTSWAVDRLGKQGPRPERLVVVATQVIEQSLDLDVDILISDLAPIALLLQRAGRCWRHEKYWAQGVRLRERPAWSTGPRMITLVPSTDADELSIPRAWGSVYHPYLLDATHKLLVRYDGETIELPGDVQALVEEVHGDGSEFAKVADAIDGATSESGKSSYSRAAWDGEVLAQRSVADCVVIPTPRNVADLSELHLMEIPEIEIGTRLGIDSVRTVCCYQQPSGKLTLDPAGNTELPEPSPHGRFTADQVRTVMAQSISVSASKLKGRDADTDVPASWLDNPWLAELVLLPHHTTPTGWHGPKIGKWLFRLDPELGLVIRE
jgi:CRISPR-associated endonuclease/helicase Cas3